MSEARSRSRIRSLLRPKVIAPVVILLATFGIVRLVHLLQEAPATRAEEDIAPLVRVIRVQPEDFRFQVTAQGTVEPRREGDLVPQVSGEVVWVSPDLVGGGFFEEGDPLVRIERSDYEASLESARANVARAESEFRRAKKERDRQRRLADRSVASEARIDDAENAFRIAEASLREGRALLERAERDLARTEIAAPYMGRVRMEKVELGQFVSRGTPIATLYAVDYAEVRLPLPDRELAYLSLALRPRMADAEEAGEVTGPEVELRAEFAGREHSWRGRVVRTEGELDPKSRMVHVVVRVEDPYDTHHDSPPGRPPLAVGLFVAAHIDGVTAQDVFVLPRSALRRERGEDEPHVLVVDSDSRMWKRPVQLLRTEHSRVILGEGLSAGEQVSVSPLRVVTDGMKVRLAADASEGRELVGSGS